MHNAPFDDIYPTARRAAQVHAAVAVLANALPSADRSDLEQEGLLAFWRALPQFDPTRAALRTFAERVIANQIASVCRAQRAARRIPPPAEAFAYSDHPGYSLDLSTDVQRVIETLGEDDRRLARLLADYSPTEASRILRTSRSTIYAGIRRIRLAFVAAGLGRSSASYRVTKSQIEPRRGRVTTKRCGPGSGERRTSERIVAQATHAEQIGICLTLLGEVA